MAQRPFFVGFVREDGHCGADEISIDFTWHAGFSVSQKQRSIKSLHESIRTQTKYNSPLEISTKSIQTLGFSLSAFNLMLNSESNKSSRMSVETAYQASKQYDNQPRSDEDRFSLTAREARLRARELQSTSQLTGWLINDHYFDLSSHTSCYDWIYLSALSQNPELMEDLLHYDCFTDIEFNPRHSLACQARSAALARAALGRDSHLEKAICQCLQASYSSGRAIHSQDLQFNV